MLDPLPSSQWSMAHAAHLLNRAGFGGTPEEVRALHAKGLNAAVDSMIIAQDDAEQFPAPPTLVPHDMPERHRLIEAVPDGPERRAAIKKYRKEEAKALYDLREWWMNRMRYSAFPLREKLTLFWHGHFATSIEKVRYPYWMYKQNEIFRKYGMGSFQDLVKWVSRDPAMIRWLDLNQSKAGNPNENFARELMELFTLGEGHYTEEDIRESARAFTGYRHEPRTMQFAFAPKQFDATEKSFMGKKGEFDGDDIIDIIFEQDQCSKFISKKLWTFYAYEEPSDELVEALAENLREKKFNITAFLSEVFRWGEFYSPQAYRTQVKSPAQWMVQTSRSLDIPLPDSQTTHRALVQMGQILFAPPNVKGWDGNKAWINTSTLLFRYNLAGYIVGNQKSALKGVNNQKGKVLPLEKIAPPEIRNDGDKLVSVLEFRLFNAPMSAKQRAACLVYVEKYHGEMTDARVRDLMLMMMSTPEFQLI